MVSTVADASSEAVVGEMFLEVDVSGNNNNNITASTNEEPTMTVEPEALPITASVVVSNEADNHNINGDGASNSGRPATDNRRTTLMTGLALFSPNNNNNMAPDNTEKEASSPVLKRATMENTENVAADEVDFVMPTELQNMTSMATVAHNDQSGTPQLPPGAPVPGQEQLVMSSIKSSGPKLNGWGTAEQPYMFPPSPNRESETEGVTQGRERLWRASAEAPIVQNAAGAAGHDFLSKVAPPPPPSKLAAAVAAAGATISGQSRRMSRTSRAASSSLPLSAAAAAAAASVGNVITGQSRRTSRTSRVASASCSLPATTASAENVITGQSRRTSRTGRAAGFSSLESAPSRESIATMRERLTALIRKKKRIRAGKVIQLFRKEFGVTLDPKKDLGVKKLKKVFEKLPGVRVVQKGPKSSFGYIEWIGAGASRVDPIREKLRKGPLVSSEASSMQPLVSSEANSMQLDKDKLEVVDTTVDMITFDQVTALNGKARVEVPTYLEENKSDDSEQEEDSEEEQGMSDAKNEKTASDVALNFFTPGHFFDKSSFFGRGLSLADRSVASAWEEGALLGHLLSGQEAVYLNTHEPFCFATVGVQGAGKSHTLSCVLESCLVPFESGNIVNLKKPMTSLVLHYDDNLSSICESAGLLNPNRDFERKMQAAGLSASSSCVSKEKAVILVSPTFYRQRKTFYGNNCTVKPLLFKWRSLTADHIKRIMRINEGDNQLYVASFMTLLRGYQREAVVPEFSQFLNQVQRVCDIKSQQGPLVQRIKLLESMVAESQMNLSLKEESLDLSTCIASGRTLVITDLTDPLLSKEEANGLFQVLTEQFRALPAQGGKLLCLDEAHKFMDGVKSDGLSQAIVNCARLMRHDGLRVAVSTQSPKALAPELLELVSVACLHHFHSHDWWVYLQSKLSLNDSAWKRILSLCPGHGLVFASSHNLSKGNAEGSHALPMQIRKRITADLGSSRCNA